MDTCDTGAEHERGPEILGRERELSRITRLVDAADGSGPKVLVLIGEPGAGKSTLVDRAAAQAAARGRRVLRVRGCEGEQDLGFAGVHQLLRPVLGGVDRLPPPQRDALRHAFGMARADGSPAPDPLVIRIAVLTLLSDAATERPLLMAVDDAQWLDVGSLDVLAFVARRLDGESAALLLAARDEAVPARFDRDFPHLTAGPLDRAAAGLLLDAQPQPPRGRIRSRILQQAAGNPLALIELARALARDPGSRDLGSAGSLPLTARLERIFAADLPALSPATRRVLLLAAAAGTTHVSDVLHVGRTGRGLGHGHGPGHGHGHGVSDAGGSGSGHAVPDAGGLGPGHAVPDPGGPGSGHVGPEPGGAEVWEPAEQAGLVRVEGGQVRLRHPLVRSAVYQAASFTERREAHLTLAAALAHEPDRRAWHLAEAALGPDEEVARALAESAERFQHRGGHAAAATALERAAELTPEPHQRARRLLAAATSAMYAGHPQWVGEIAGRVEALTDDPRLLAEASLRAGWSLAVTLRHDDALAFLLPVAESMAVPAPALALSALGTAATPAYNSGDPRYRHDIQRIDGLIARQQDKTDRVWVRAAGHPFTDRQQLLKSLTHAVETLSAGSAGSEGSLAGLVSLGAAAWVLDETDEAVRLLGQAMEQLRRAATAGANCTVAQALALAHFESGAWSAARSAAEEAFWMAAEAGADNVTVGSPLLQATLRAARGDHAGARAQADDAVRGRDLRKSRSLYVRYRQALGMAALAEGDYESAYGQLRRAFTQGAHPAPVHYHASLYHLADLAAAAVRAGQTDDARAVLHAAERTLERHRSVRLAAIVHRASALLSDPDDPDDAETRFRAATGDPAGARWSFEYALAHLDFGEWLRRRRRTAEARPLLGTALDIFERLDARPWTERTTAELRAAGVAVAPSAAHAALASLTPQELQIARLAAEGLTNRDIGARLYLSPRTIGFHLHKIFPKLGITGRAHLRDVLGEVRRPD